MSTHPFHRFGCRLSSLLAFATLSAASASANAKPTPVRVCRPTPTVSDPSVLRGCTDLLGDVRIERTDSETLTDLSTLRRVKGTLVIAHNPRLTSLEGLSSLRSVEGLVVSDNPALETVHGLDRLERAPRVEITGNRALGVLEGPNSLRHVDQLVVRNNGLFRLAGFQNLVSAGDVVIAKNARLIYTSGLSQLVTVDNLTLIENPRLAPVNISFGSPPTIRMRLTVLRCPGIAPADLRRDG